MSPLKVIPAGLMTGLLGVYPLVFIQQQAFITNLVQFLPMAAVVGILVAPLVALAGIISIGAIKLDVAIHLPDGLDLSPFIAMLIGLRAIAMMVTERRDTRIPAPLLGLFLVVSIGLCASYLHTHNPQYGMTKTWEWLFSTSVVLFAPMMLCADERDIQRLFLYLVGISALIALEIIRQSTSLHGGRSAFGGSYLGVARIIALGIVLVSTYFLMRPSSWWIRTGWGIVLVVLLFGLLRTGARGPVLSVTATFLAIALLQFKQVTVSQRRILLGSAIAIPLLVTLLLLALPQYFESLLVRGALLASGGGDSVQSRVQRLDVTQDIIMNHPILGVGAGGFSWLFRGVRSPVVSSHPLQHQFDGIRAQYPHNLPLELFAEAGLVTGLAFLAMVIWAIVRLRTICLSAPHLSAYVTPVLALIILSTANALVSGDINSNRPLIAGIGLAATLIALAHPTAKEYFPPCTSGSSSIMPPALPRRLDHATTI